MEKGLEKEPIIKDILINIEESFYHSNNAKSTNLLKLITEEINILPKSTEYQITLCASENISYSRIKYSMDILQNKGYQPSLCSQ